MKQTPLLSCLYLCCDGVMSILIWWHVSSESSVWLVPWAAGLDFIVFYFIFLNEFSLNGFPSSCPSSYLNSPLN